MSKAVLISIQPKWCEKIANGKKTIEVRKTKPKLKTPFKVYIYCTNTPKYHHLYDLRPFNKGEKIKLGCVQHNSTSLVADNYINGKVIGEFVCDEITEYRAEFTDLQYSDARHKKVCQNTIKWVERDDENEETVYSYETSNEEDDPDNCKFLKRSCLTFNEVRKYIGETFFDKPFYGWNISQLKIYDKPKELSDFRKPCPYTDGTYCIENKCEYYGDWTGVCRCWVERPPQSWCYVEEGVGNGKKEV